MIAEEAGSHGIFQTTRWSVVLASGQAGTGSEGSDRALADLCRIYWRPVFAFVRRRGHNVADAQDLTQSFFLKILEGDLLQHADPQRGRFRTLLLRALTNFLNDDYARRSAKKRGGGLDLISLDQMVEEFPFLWQASQEAVEAWPAERVFDVRWAATVVEQAQWRLREECDRSGRRRVFDAVRSYLSAERADVSYSVIGEQLGVPEATVKRLVHRLRQRYRELLRDEVSQTVESLQDVDEELRYLCAVLSVETEK